MDVIDIVNRVAEFALDELDSQTQLQNRILADLNASYKEMVQEAADNDDDLLEEYTGTLVNGSMLIVPDFTLIAAVSDNDNGGFEFQRTDLATLKAHYRVLEDNSGAGRFYYIKKKTLYTYPRNNANMSVLYYPKANELTLASTEDDILIPHDFHQVLIDGCVYYMKLREQGFHNQNDRAEAYQLFQQGIKDYLTAAEARTKGPRRTVTYDF